HRADVAIVERWKEGLPPLWQPDAFSGREPLVAAEPEIMHVDPVTQRWVEFRDRQGNLVTVIEVLSPANKLYKQGRAEYRFKQQNLLQAGVNLVEIDLLRVGEHVLAVEEGLLRPLEDNASRYLICAHRWERPNRREIYYCPLKEALPTIRIPLRTSDPDVPLALQSLVDRVYQTGGCWHLDHRKDPPGEEWSEAESEWIDARLREVGLRGSSEGVA
ncbi:MAG: DUF4058 family protein, partial [Verrucomicrobiales bacterium]